jgi:uridine kinase
VVLLEGNYLLLPTAPWAELGELLDLRVYVSAPTAERVHGLVRRQMARGLDPTAARDWVQRSDEANARLVEQSRGYADVVLERSPSPSATTEASGANAP